MGWGLPRRTRFMQTWTLPRELGASKTIRAGGSWNDRISERGRDPTELRGGDHPSEAAAQTPPPVLRRAVYRRSGGLL